MYLVNYPLMKEENYINSRLWENLACWVHCV